jgi:hypothetical protein
MLRKNLSINTDSDNELAASRETIDPAWIVDTPGLAEILGLKPKTIEIWVRKRKLPVIKLSNRCQRFRVADVFRALQKFEVKEK